MYFNDETRIKVGDYLSDVIHPNQGVRQGCILSPLLFNIYLADLPARLEAGKTGPKINDKTFNSIIWADDLLLLSETEVGLNNMLNALNQYATEKNLHININKTKVMIFNKTGRHIRKNFCLGRSKIETCSEYKYLGFKITPYGGINPGLCDLKDRALKAYYKMKYEMGPSFRKHPLITIRIFQTLIQPILLLFVFSL